MVMHRSTATCKFTKTPSRCDSPLSVREVGVFLLRWTSSMPFCSLILHSIFQLRIHTKKHLISSVEASRSRFSEEESKQSRLHAVFVSHGGKSLQSQYSIHFSHEIHYVLCAWLDSGQALTDRYTTISSVGSKTQLTHGLLC